VKDSVSSISTHATQAAGFILQTTSTALLTVVFTLFTMFYVTLEWPSLMHHLECLLPLEQRHTRALFLELREVGRGVFLGTIGSAVVQGALAGVGLAIAGVPRALTLALLTIFSSFLPVFGTALVWAPAAAFLFATGKPGQAVFVIAWGL